MMPAGTRPWWRFFPTGLGLVSQLDDTSGTNVLNGVSCTSVGSCVAVGYYDDGGTSHTLVETLSG